MTPAINAAQKANISYKVHEYQHDSNAESFGLEAAAKLGVAMDIVFKTLVVQADSNRLAVAVIPVSSQLSMKLIAKAVGAKKVMMADKGDVMRSTGYVLGGVSPLGQKKRLCTIIDSSAIAYDSIFVSAGRRGLEIELTPDDLRELVKGTFHDICQ
ncbi:MAG: Cys-tRNA(Pro) deacylase [Aestuariibacter sp.]